MRLILKIISYKGLPLAGDMSAEFTEQGGSIGRKQGNTMVLADAEHIVSGRHAEIFFQNGAYLIKDVSTNGTMLINSGLELKNTSAPLQADEIIRLGEYEVSVKIVAEQLSAVSSPFEAPFGSPSAFPDPFAPSFQSEPLLDIPANPRQDFQDIQPLFSGLDSFGQEERPFSVNTPYKEQAPSSPFQDSFIVPDVRTAETAETNIEQFLKGLDGLSSIDAPRNDAFPGVDPFVETPVAVIDTPPPSQPDQFLESLAVSDSHFPQPAFILEPVPTPAPAPAPVATTTATAPSTQAGVAEASIKGDSEMLRMFLLGAGITDSSFLAAVNGPDAMQSIGGLFRGLIEGLMDVLRARAEMKSEFRVSVTTLRSVDNNPLKFNPDVESVLKLLIAPKNPAFTDADTAVKEAFKDIKFHQMAMTAGIQASLTDILLRFNPESFEKRLGEGLVFQKKARCWELYCEQYPELKNLALDDFFGDQFAEAYEKQMLLLSKRQT